MLEPSFHFKHFLKGVRSFQGIRGQGLTMSVRKTI